MLNDAEAFEQASRDNAAKKNTSTDGEVRYSKRRNEGKSSYSEWDVQAALYDALDHEDKGYDRLIKVGTMPKYIVDKLGIDGDFYIYRNHIYENMVSKEQAIEDGRYDKEKHYHDLGFETIEAAIMALENPILSIATKTKKNNPAVAMILPVKGKNGVPLYSVISFYSSMSINGDFSKKPHVVLSIYEMDMVKENNGETKNSRNKSLEEVIEQAVKDGKVFDFDKKMRDALSVIAERTRLGDVTETSLNESLAQFHKEIKTFKKKNEIKYSTRNRGDETARDIIANALEGIATTEADKELLKRYKNKLKAMEEKATELAKKRAELKELMFTKGERSEGTKAKMKQLNEDIAKLEKSVRAFDKRLLTMESTKFLGDVVDLYRKADTKALKGKFRREFAEMREKKDAEIKAVRDQYREKISEGVENRGRKAGLERAEKLTKELITMLTKPTDKKHVPEDMATVVGEFLNDLDFTPVIHYGKDGTVANAAAVVLKTGGESEALKRWSTTSKSTPQIQTIINLCTFAYNKMKIIYLRREYDNIHSPLGRYGKFHCGGERHVSGEDHCG